MRLAPEWPLLVASGTPEADLQSIVARRGLDAYFRGVYGSPRSESELPTTIPADLRAEPSHLLLIGDAAADYEAAAAMGSMFVGRVANGAPNLFPSRAPIVADLDELEARWPTLTTELAALRA